MRILIAGCGWLGRALGRSLVADGHRVTGIRRSPDACRALEGEGIQPLCCDLTAPDVVQDLPHDIEAIVACQSADGRDVDSYRRAYLQATAPLLQLAGRGDATRLIWIGSTGVFGQNDGGEVDERTPLLPAGPTGDVLVQAEDLVLTAARDGLPASVLRLSGLYGPERYGVIDRVRTGRLALGPTDSAWMNWCHRKDAVLTIRSLIDRGQPGRVYHASDANPATRRDVVQWIADGLGIEPPVAGPATPPARAANRRVSARATREELGLELAFPSFRDGLARAFDSDDSP